MSDKRQLEQNIHYWLGQLQMADEFIRLLQKYSSPVMLIRLEDAKKARAEVMRKIQELAR
jgi:hypothetical protein